MKNFLHVFLLLIIAGTLTVSIAQPVSGDYRSVSSVFGANWNNVNSWEKYNGSTWISPSPEVPNFTSTANTVTILSGHIIDLDMFPNVGNIVVNGQLRNTAGSIGIFVWGDITVAGTFGGPLGNIAIALNNNTGAGTTTVSGSGTIGLEFFIKSNSANNWTLDLQADVNLYGVNPFQNSSSQTFTVKTTSGTLNIAVATSLSNTVAYDFSTGTVEYSRGDGVAQTVFGTSYNNLTLSGSGVKTIASTTVNGDMTLAGTATVSGIIDYASTGQLIYNGSSAQLTGDELHSAANFNNLLINRRSINTRCNDS